MAEPEANRVPRSNMTSRSPPWARTTDDTQNNIHRNQIAPPSYQDCTRESEPLDITQRIERRLAQYNASQNVFKRWLFEILSVTTSTCCIGAIIAILVSLGDAPLARWPFGLTVINVLSKIASAALILPISEAIGQLKWSWFHGKQSKDAFDFEIFDKASRGAWGSVLLLFRTRGRSLAALGALLTVLLLAIDTFFQQVTDLPERWTSRGEGLIPRAIRYEPEVVYAYQSNSGDMPIAQPNLDLRWALTPLFYDQNSTEHSGNRNGSRLDLPLSCPTSVCKWNPYQTLGVCSACTDITNLLTYACLPMRMDWIRSATGPSTEHTYQNGTACGYFLNATSTEPVLVSGYRLNDNSSSTYGETLLMRTIPLITNPDARSLYDGSINFRHIVNPILDALIFSAADGSESSVYRKDMPIAHECMLAWCVKTLRSTYSWGKYEEMVEEEHFETTKTPYPWHTVFHPEIDVTATDYFANVSIYPPNTSGDSLGFGLSNDTMMDTIFSFGEVFPSVITVESPGAKPFLKVRTSFIDRVMFRAFRYSPWLAPNNITQHMERIALAVTNVVRSDISSTESIKGQAFAPETYVEVKWAWLAFPLAMLIMCVVFLVATMVKTSRGGHEDIGVWKTSAMPTLIYSLPKECRERLTKNSSSQTMSGREPKNVKIRLMPNEGWRVSGQIYTSQTLQRRGDPRAPPGWV
ncbi:hypothetical protein HBI24_128460 [Parastagonospora nodorum]|nr:hypothetical protein HBH99_180370 [Parastagonospora nodorum]KAH4408145.1 hypothetical protein HBH92_153230 [Parastagonospora nodorum]KAH4442205.1 hypothetical protein HBH93_077250 [Parastagonospora nodorum]KAH4453764.1 hypothetical protein HBH91_105480 [Parastagonospora nodorum]KAH4546526.1 hypothetical protein HBH86_139170 [Parastagonospora nodorum]